MVVFLCQGDFGDPFGVADLWMLRSSSEKPTQQQPWMMPQSRRASLAQKNHHLSIYPLHFGNCTRIINWFGIQVDGL